MKRLLVMSGAALALPGAVAVVVGGVLAPAEAAQACLFGFLVVFTTLVGTLFLLMIGHASNATWFVPLRRQCEHVLGAMPFVALLLVPVLVLVYELYPWTHPHELPHLVQHHVEKKLGWLNVAAFVSRSAGYMLTFVVFCELLRRWSLEQDEARDEATARKLRRRMVGLSVGGLFFLSFVLTFAAWDWIMSLDPAWYSDLYGIYIFAGGFVASLGLLGAMTVVGKREGVLPNDISSDHFHAVGRLQLAMVIFWTYIGWAHVLQQWIANVPAEQLWHLARYEGGWGWIGILLIVSHFLLPFLVLLSRDVKKHARSFLAISTWLMLVHVLDVFYLTMPAFSPGKLRVSWLSFASLAVVLGGCVLTAVLRAGRTASVPLRDPLLGSGLAYESQS